MSPAFRTNSIMSEPMTGPARDALKLYLNQESRRSLRHLAAECAKNGIKASLPTLKRWSVHYQWRRLAYEHDQALADDAKSITREQRERAVKAQLDLVWSAVKRYRWLIDPNNANVTPAQRRRASNITTKDYIRLVELDLQLTKRYKELTGREPGIPERRFTDDEIRAMAQAFAKARFSRPHPSGKRRPFPWEEGFWDI